MLAVQIGQTCFVTKQNSKGVPNEAALVGISIRYLFTAYNAPTRSLPPVFGGSSRESNIDFSQGPTNSRRYLDTVESVYCKRTEHVVLLKVVAVVLFNLVQARLHAYHGSGTH
jgi:hypothetical protein